MKKEEQRMHSCGRGFGHLSRSSFEWAMAETRGVFYGKVSKGPFQKICPRCDAYILCAETTHPLPFENADGLLCTISDGEICTSVCPQESEQNLLSLGRLRFTDSALKSALHLNTHVGNPPARISVQDAELEVEREVGRESLLSFGSWLKTVGRDAPDCEVISFAFQIDELSFEEVTNALQQMLPERFAALDRQTAHVLGLAHTRQGYELWIALLQAFKHQHAGSESMSLIGAAVLFLTTQCRSSR